jgi:hypothetical protein
MIKAELEKKTDKVKMTEIPKGKFVLQFGFKVPSFLTPAMPFAFEAIKKEVRLSPKSPRWGCAFHLEETMDDLRKKGG